MCHHLQGSEFLQESSRVRKLYHPLKPTVGRGTPRVPQDLELTQAEHPPWQPCCLSSSLLSRPLYKVSPATFSAGAGATCMQRPRIKSHRQTPGKVGPGETKTLTEQRMVTDAPWCNSKGNGHQRRAEGKAGRRAQLSADLPWSRREVRASLTQF